MALKFLSVISLLLVTLFSISPAMASLSSDKKSENTALSEKEIRSEIMQEFTRWKGVKYRLGGTSTRGIDCSSLMQKIYHEAFEDQPERHLPRTTAQQLKEGVRASRNDLRPGDLVFFNISSGRHVGVYIGDSEFIHASTSKGVIISTLENDYWSDRFKSARRIIG